MNLKLLIFSGFNKIIYQIVPFTSMFRKIDGNGEIGFTTITIRGGERGYKPKTCLQ